MSKPQKFQLCGARHFGCDFGCVRQAHTERGHICRCGFMFDGTETDLHFMVAPETAISFNPNPTPQDYAGVRLSDKDEGSGYMMPESMQIPPDVPLAVARRIIQAAMGTERAGCPRHPAAALPTYCNACRALLRPPAGVQGAQEASEAAGAAEPSPDAPAGEYAQGGDASCGFCGGAMPCYCPDPLTPAERQAANDADDEARNRVD